MTKTPIGKILQESATNNPRNEKAFIAEAVNRILGEDINSGDTVAVVEDPITGHHGVKGIARGVSSKGSGFMDVELESGVTLPMQSSLLVKV